MNGLVRTLLNHKDVDSFNIVKTRGYIAIHIYSKEDINDFKDIFDIIKKELGVKEYHHIRQNGVIERNGTYTSFIIGLDKINTEE